MKQFQISLFLFLSIFAFGQSKKLTNEEIKISGVSKINFIENCNEATKLAETDIKNEIIVLFLQSGEAPIIYYEDEIF